MADSTSSNSSNYASHGNHPISGQLFSFSTKSSANAWQKEVEAATGFKPQVFEDDAHTVEAEPTITPDSPSAIVSEPAPLN